MLRQRVITALVLVTLLLSALFAQEAIYWRVLINVAIFIGFWEWLRFCKLSGTTAQGSAYVVFAAAVAALQYGLIPPAVVVPVTCFIWLGLFVFTMSDVLDFLHHQLIKLVIGVIILSVAGMVVIELKNLPNGPLWILCFMVSIFAADIGAYFVGRRFGKTKLAPQVSPGKTVEGLLGGLVFALLIFVPLMLYWFEPWHALSLLITVLVTVLVSVMGDLFESKQKRYADMKDSSQILPGHGGVLDRIDSLLSGAPFFAIGLILLGHWYSIVRLPVGLNCYPFV